MPQATREHNRFRLIHEIIALSVANGWDEAKQEWSLADVFFADREEPGVCLCGHHPIIENCILHNTVNGNTAIVGNVCVKKVMGLTTEKLFEGLRRIVKDNTTVLTANALEHAWRKRWITDWEHNFYLDTLRRRHLSPRQLAKRCEINDKILFHVQRKR